VTDFFRLSVSAAFTALSLSMVSAPSPAKADGSQCQPFPKLAVWSHYTHSRIQGFVESKYDGDWQPLISRLEQRQKTIAARQESGQTLELKLKGRKIYLTGKKLAAYVRAAEMRLDVVRCLAEESSVANLDNFATAAGSATPARNVKISAIRGANLDLRAESRCEDGDVVFRITNEGASWPKSGNVALYGVGDGEPKKVSSRRMRMKTGQHASFKVKAKYNATGQVGLFINPSWAKRPFALDATVSCR